MHNRDPSHLFDVFEGESLDYPRSAQIIGSSLPCLPAIISSPTVHLSTAGAG